MISLGGLSTRIGLNLVDATRDRQIELVRSSAQHARAIDGFREKIGAIETVDQLMEDRELYVFVMKAFDLEDQIFGKALIKKMLKSDIDDPKGLVNRLTDPRFREMHDVLQFGPGGVGNNKTLLTKWQNGMVERYVERQFINNQAEQNEAIGTVLEFRGKVGEVANWFDVLKDKGMASFMRTALGLPKEMVRLDIDRQAALFASKLDIEDLQDPAVVEKLERKFVAITDALDTSRSASNAAVQLMSAAVSGGQFVPITLDISAITSLSGRGYR